MAKKISLLVFVLIAATFFWVASESWISDPTWSLANPQPWLMPLGFLVILAAALGLSFMLLEQFWFKVAASFVSVLPFVAIFGFHDPIYFGAAFVLVAMHLDAIERIKQEVKNRLKLDARLTVRRGVNMIVLPHLLLISFAYYQTPEIKNAGQDAKLPKNIELAIQEAAEIFIGPKLEELPPAQRAQIEGQVYNELLRQITAFAKPYISYLPPVLAFGLFLALQGLSPIFFFLASIVAAVIFWLLLKFNLASVEEKDVKAEVLKF